MAVEVAIGAFADAKRPVDVERERLAGQQHLLTRCAANSVAMMRMLPIALLLATPCAAATCQVRTGRAPADRGEMLLRDTVLASHNMARARFGVPRRWGGATSSPPPRWVMRALWRSTGIYGHDQTPGRRKTSGENLWRGQRGLFSYDVMVGGMVEEARCFRPGVFPDNSCTGEWHDVGHYTQIVWPATTEVGCALASSRDDRLSGLPLFARREQGRRVPGEWARPSCGAPASQQLAKRGD